MLRQAAAILALAALAACGQGAQKAPSAPSAAPAALIPRAALFADPEREHAQISPDGKWLSYIDRRGGKRTLTAALVADRVDTRKIAEGAADYVWSADGAFILYRAVFGPGRQFQSGGEDYVAYPAGAGAWHAVDLLKTGEDRVLIAEPGAHGLPPSPAHAGQVAFTLGGDLYEIDIRTGARTLKFRNRDGYGDFVLDAQSRPAVGLKRLPTGDLEITALTGAPKKLLIIPAADAPQTRLLGAAPDGASFLMVSTFGRKHAALMRVDVGTGAMTSLAQDDAADITVVWRTPSTGELEAYAASSFDPRWKPLNQIAAADLALLKQNLKAFEVVSRSADNTKWIVREQTPSLAPRIWLYDRAAKKVERLFSEYPPLEGAAFATPKSVKPSATFEGLLFEPAGNANNGALIVLIRDAGASAPGGFDADAQYFVNLGYAVVAVRGEGAAAEVSRWAIGQHLATAGKNIALIGERRALGALPLKGDFGCAVVIDSAPYAKLPNVTAEKIMLARRGAEEEKPSVAASIQFPDETQSFTRAENRVAYNALAGAFISGCLGGRIAPIGGDLQNSSVQILSGQDLIPTLKAAMAPRESEAGAPP